MENLRFELNRMLIAPCGMNCGLCMAFLRDKNVCKGCWSKEGYKAKSCVNCIIKNCDLLNKLDSKFCYDCENYPCKRLIQLDKRYRTKYHMSMIENLNMIKVEGIVFFIQFEYNRWTCKNCGGIICVHRGYCSNCKMEYQEMLD